MTETIVRSWAEGSRKVFSGQPPAGSDLAGNNRAPSPLKRVHQGRWLHNG
jgi:hypothetical protein